MASFLGINNEELEKAMEEAIDCTGMANDEGSEVITESKHSGHKGNLYVCQEYRNIRRLLYESTQRTDHSHPRYSNTVSLYSTSIFTHSHICTINDP